MAANSPKFVVIGGGTGSFTLLSTLKDYVRDITALVNMADDGGSTGVLRDELGVLPPGDIRQCLVALSDAPERLRALFNYRFPEGTFEGHSVGNLFLSAVERMTNDFGEAVDLASEILRIDGRVLPMTLDNCTLVYKPSRGQPIVGQYAIETSDFNGLKKPKLSFDRKVSISPAAEAAILEADVVVVAPGNLYSSLVPALMVKGVGEALRKTDAKVVYVANLVNKPTQTRGFKVHDYVRELERFAGGKFIDYVLYNIDKPTRGTLRRYALQGELPVAVDVAAFNRSHYQAMAGNYLSKVAVKRDKNDNFIKRSLIRHDGDAIARKLMRIYFS